VGTIQGDFPADSSNTAVKAGWRASLKPFDSPHGAGPGGIVLQEVALEVWWQPESGNRRIMQLAGYRQAQVPQVPIQ